MAFDQRLAQALSEKMDFFLLTSGMPMPCNGVLSLVTLPCACLDCGFLAAVHGAPWNSCSEPWAGLATRCSLERMVGLSGTRHSIAASLAKNDMAINSVIGTVLNLKPYVLCKQK